MANLDQIIGAFSSGLFGLYKLASEEVGAHKKDRPRWLQSYMIFCALERCRSLIGGQVENAFCRFSLGKRKPGNPKVLEDFLHKFRKLNDAVTLRPEQLKEHLVDFSISMGTVEQGWGDEDLPAGVKFRLLLVAESEINKGFGKDVLAEGLKLLDTIAPIKVLVFPSCSEKSRNEHERRLTKLFNSHGPEGHQDNCQWLLLAIPKFDDWQKYEGDPSKMSRQVYTLAACASGKGYTLLDLTEHWTKVVPDL